MNQFGGHHPDCPGGWGECPCPALWLAHDEAASDDLDCAYGQFYDPDFDSDPYAERESYGGWSRAYPGGTR